MLLNILHTDGYYEKYKIFIIDLKENKLKLPDNINFFDIYYYEKI